MQFSRLNCIGRQLKANQPAVNAASTARPEPAALSALQRTVRIFTLSPANLTVAPLAAFCNVPAAIIVGNYLPAEI
jgi:hypothetical protein